MNRRKRLRRVALLCIHFARNLAFYRAGIVDGKLIRNSAFWKTLNFNFYDLSILEWCKLFADFRGKHYWGKIVRNKEDFESGLLSTLSTKRDDLDAYVDEVRRCRDKFIAHLDSDQIDYRPHMDLALKSAIYYYQFILRHENEEDNYLDFPKDLQQFYDTCYREAKLEYS
jgi:hypothetical protein